MKKKSIPTDFFDIPDDLQGFHQLDELSLDKVCGGGFDTVHTDIWDVFFTDDPEDDQ